MNSSDVTRSHAEQRAAYSNFAHVVVGMLLAVVAALAALEVFGTVSGGWRYLWPALLVGTGLFVPLFIWLAAREHRVPLARVLADPQQRQHFTLSGWMLLGGPAEMLALAGVLPTVLGLVWPLVLALIGYGFLSHTQHGRSEAMAKAVRAHRVLGGTLILAGLARGIEILSGIHEGTVGLGWVVLLFAAALQFMWYREPDGAYAGGDGGSHVGH